MMIPPSLSSRWRRLLRVAVCCYLARAAWRVRNWAAVAGLAQTGVKMLSFVVRRWRLRAAESGQCSEESAEQLDRDFEDTIAKGSHGSTDEESRRHRRRRFCAVPVFTPLVDMVAEDVPCPDGESAVVWWPREQLLRHHRHRRPSDDVLWVLLPGGLKPASTFSTEEVLHANLFESDRWCAFHNPGVANACVGRTVTPLTDVTYLEHYLTSFLPQHAPWCKRVRLIGFSAGSMLAIAASSRIRFRPGPDSIRITCAVGIHGPDKIRHVMEFHQTSTSLDVFFSYMSYTTMVGSGSTRCLPEARGGGLHEEWMPWLAGWRWMRPYLEKCFGRPWMEMEEELWSCSRDMSASARKEVAGSRLPGFGGSGGVGTVAVMRILSVADPVVPFETIDQSLFRNLDEVLVQPSSGHCAAFSGQPGLARILQDWVQEKEAEQMLQQQEGKEDKGVVSAVRNEPASAQRRPSFDRSQAEEKVAAITNSPARQAGNTSDPARQRTVEAFAPFSTPLRRKLRVCSPSDRALAPSGVPSPMLPNLRDSPPLPLDRDGDDGWKGGTGARGLGQEVENKGHNNSETAAAPVESESWDAPTSELKQILQRRRRISDGGVALGGVIHDGGNATAAVMADKR